MFVQLQGARPVFSRHGISRKLCLEHNIRSHQAFMIDEALTSFASAKLCDLEAGRKFSPVKKTGFEPSGRARKV